MNLWYPSGVVKAQNQFGLPGFVCGDLPYCLAYYGITIKAVARRKTVCIV